MRKLSLIAAVLALASLPVASAQASAPGLAAAGVVGAPARATASNLVAPASACPGQDRLSAPIAQQEQAMLCMTNFARARNGLADLTPSSALAASAAAKGGDVLRCDSFSHFACGREFSYWIREAGYMSAPCWRIGENLAWGTGEYGSVRSIFEAWLRSPDHRANILGDFAEVGIDLRRGTLDGQPSTRVWTQHFGSHCG